jgi:hypothetical protein
MSVLDRLRRLFVRLPSADPVAIRREEYQRDLEEMASALSQAPISLSSVRELLILSAHSCAPARSFFSTRLESAALVGLLMDAVEDKDGAESGDARIEGAHYLGMANRALLESAGDRLLRLYDAETDERPGGNLRPLLSLALAQGTISGGIDRIEADIARGEDHQHLHEALRRYRAVA